MSNPRTTAPVRSIALLKRNGIPACRLLERLGTNVPLHVVSPIIRKVAISVLRISPLNMKKYLRVPDENPALPNDLRFRDSFPRECWQTLEKNLREDTCSDPSSFFRTFSLSPRALLDSVPECRS